MDSGLKQRLIGAAVLVALAVIFLPMLVKEPAPDGSAPDLPFKAPSAPGGPPRSVTSSLSGQAEPTQPTLNEGEPTATASAAEVKLPPVAANGTYVVHFAAFASNEDAELTVSQLQAYGLPAFAEPFTLSGRPAVRVRIGPYQTQAEAEIVRVQAAQVRADVQPRVFMLVDQAAAQRTVAPPEQTGANKPTITPPKQTGANKPAIATAEQSKAANNGQAARANNEQNRVNSSSKAAAPEVGFVVQLGAFSNAAKATDLQESLRKAGVAAFTDTVNTSNGTLTRINAGPVSSRAEANALKSKAKSVLGVDGVVRSHP